MTPSNTVQNQETTHTRNAALVSAAVGIALLAIKFWAFKLTGSQAVFSDAMESIVNVIAALFSIFVVIIAAKPADQDHPYGHGKVEFFSAAFEGGLISFAAVLICAEAIQALVSGHALNHVNVGVLVVLGAGIANLLLGLFLLRSGRRSRSAALVASAKHVISDFWTSAGVAFGLLLVSLTGIQWLDPAMALLVGLFLLKTGVQLARGSIGGLLDEEDREILNTLVRVVSRVLPEGIIQLHYTRVIRSGKFHHIDAHVVVPEFWDVARAHTETESFERSVMAEYPNEGELHFHVDPCRRAYCRVCEVHDCPIRRQPFEARRVLTVDEITSPVEPSQFRKA